MVHSENREVYTDHIFQNHFNKSNRKIIEEIS